MLQLGRLFSDDHVMEAFRRKYDIPVGVQIREDDSGNDSMNINGGWTKLPLIAITETGIRFPLPKLLRELLDILGLNPCQLCPKSYRIIGGILKLNQMEGIDIDVWEILYCYDVRPTNVVPTYQFALKARKGYNIIECLPSSSSSRNDNKMNILVGGSNWEFPESEVEPILCRVKLGKLARVPHWTRLKRKIDLDRLNSKIFNTKVSNFRAGVYWRSSPVLARYDPTYKVFTSLPIGISNAKAREFFSSEKFRVLLRDQEEEEEEDSDEEEEDSDEDEEDSKEDEEDSEEDDEEDEEATPAPKGVVKGFEENSIEEEELELEEEEEEEDSPAPKGVEKGVEDNSMEEEEERTNVESLTHRVPDPDSDIPLLRIEGNETRIVSDGDYRVDDTPSLEIHGHNLPRTLASESEILPSWSYGANKRKRSAHLQDERGSILNDIVGSSVIRPANIDSMPTNDVASYSKIFVEKMGEDYMCATKEMSRLNALVESLERRASTAENKLLAVEFFSEGYQREICELKEKLKLLESRGQRS